MLVVTASPAAGAGLEPSALEALKSQPVVYVAHDPPRPLRLRFSSYVSPSILAIDDPVAQVAETTAARLALALGLTNLRMLEATPTDLARVQAAAATAAVLDVKTTDWEIHPHSSDSDAFVLEYRARLRVLRAGDHRTVWEAECQPAVTDVRSPLPTLAELHAERGARLSTLIAETADACAKDLVAQAVGRPIRRPPPAKVEVKLKRPTLDEVERRLVGPGGIVGGDARFEVEIEDLALTAPDVGRVRTLLQQALTAPRGSDLKVEGTIDGRDFKARLEKNKAGRSEMKLEGFQFADDARLREFVAPFLLPSMKELKIEARVADRRREITFKPATGGYRER